MFPRTVPGSRLSATVLIAVLLLLGAVAAPAQITISYEQSGHVRLPDGTPVQGFVLRLYEEGVPLYRQTTTDADGRFEFFVEQFHDYTISTSFFNYGWQNISPEVRSGTAYTHYQFHDFTATPYPTVRGSVRDVAAAGFSLSGVQVLVGTTVKDYTDADGDYEFTVGANESGTISFRKSLHNFTPPTMSFQAGTWQTITMPTADMRLDNIYDNPYIVTSWEENSGPGWTYFPLCPAHDEPHNPNVYAELYFAPGYLSTAIPADRMRMYSMPAGVIMSGLITADVGVGNGTGRETSFATPIIGCGTTTLTLAIGVDQLDGSVVWYDVGSTATGASDYDLTPDGVINLSDVGEFAAALGTHPGDPDYNACADFNSDGNIDLIDVSSFASHIGHASAKADSDWTDVEAPAALLAAQVLTRPDGVDVEFGLDLDREWLSARMTLPGDGWTEKDLQWTPARAFAGEGLVLIDAEGRASLQLFSDGTADGGPVGTLTVRKVGSGITASQLELTDLRARPEPELEEGGIKDESAPDDGTSIWSRRSVGSAAGAPLDISFRLPRSAPVDLEIFDLRGRSVTSLLDGDTLPSGEHSRQWDGKDDGGHAVPAGMYFARLKSGATMSSLKLVVVR